MFLNKVKIKTRLIMLCVIPAIVVSVGAYLILNHLSLTSIGYRVAANKIELIDESLSLNRDMYRLLTDRMKTGEWSRKKMKNISTATQQLIENTRSDTSLEQFSSDFSNLTELRLFVQNLSSVGENSINDSAQLWFALMYDVLVSINKIQIPSVNAGLYYVSSNYESLSWFLYWMQKESWLVNAIKLQSHVSGDIRNEYKEVISRQQIYWENFVNYSANDEQLKEMNKLLVSENFQKAHLFRTVILNGNLDSKLLTQGIQMNAEKVNSLLKLLSGYSLLISKKIKHQTKIASYQIWAVRIIVGFLLSLLVYVSLDTFYRISGKLTRILNTMQKLRNKSGNIDLIKIDGNDEVCQFAMGLNSIIVQLSEHEKRLITAKEEAISANKAKSVFLANISHEIRTPLNGIIGLAEILTMQNLNSAQKEIVEDIEVSSQTLLVLINDILDLSKIESGKLSIAPTLCNVRDIIYSTVNLVSTKALSHLNELHINIDESVPAHVYIDGFRYKQIVMNLLSNAVKFTHEGFVKVTLSYDNVSSSLTCAVNDTGIGIPDDRIEAVFRPFHQGDSSITRRFGGTGLGLTICDELVGLMDGKINVDSEEGKGSVFSFTIPIPKPNNQEPFQQFSIRLALILNNSPYSEQIENECALHGVSLEKMNNVDDFIHHSDSGNVDAVLYCSNVAENDVSEIKKLRKKNANRKIISLQHHLFVSSEIINITDGNIVLPFMGSKFVLLLKKQLGSQLYSMSSNNLEAESESGLLQPTVKKILIVEDNLMNQKIAGFFLDKADFEYTVVNNGQEAVDTVAQGLEYSAILMDCMMPVMDGLTATTIIREWEKKNHKAPVPIIALTASVLDEDVVKCFEAGMDAYLPKPYKSEQLYELFEKFNITTQWR
ncbi:ATP-binding protein [Vibrio salinus]|uniref:ATP-binding protein n=1 Tax=Vibrio salinus TaxID=2899784 RepID=UPI001E3BC37F|nr:ATP-binding protein [Vibrio salinus]MCE0495327.1 ATP-binding protein [Vibrio salinus]